YHAAGVKKVVVSAPVKEGDALNLVYGINHHLYDPATHHLITAASCTTNCLAPVVKVIHDALGIEHGSITTIHDVTNTQTIVDRPAKDMRRARSALMNLIPTTTGSATAITLIYPELAGRLNGHAVRVPLLNASLTDCVFEVSRPTTAAEVNALFKAASLGALAGILGYEERPLVSCDYLNDPRSAIIDAGSTMVTGGTQVKIFAWYDNEWGYACRLVDVVRMVAGGL
ncbi:MAG: glyceraldehyde-3-phosphate dehydrogenase, partial [Paracoccaceae bacterium]|nr:glyceraldehyde-3-phosphate dehydrogenase [Paracoccaceae bacterium]